MPKKKEITNPALTTWQELNAQVVTMSDTKELKALLSEERRGRKRARFLARIQSRLNRVQFGRGRGVAKKKP